MQPYQPHESIWTHTVSPTEFPPLAGDTTSDVVVVGAGITGLTAAALLGRAGRQVTVVDQYGIGAGTSGHTTAHFTTVLDAGYRHIENKFSRKTAQKVAQALTDSIAQVEQLVNELGIDADFTRLPGYLYAESVTGLDETQTQFNVASRVGLPVSWQNTPPLPFHVAGGYRVENQARLHPTKYLNGLTNAVQGNGGQIFGGTRVTEVSGSGPLRVKTDRGTITANFVLMATHTPAGIHSVQTVLKPMRSYVLGVRANTSLPDALFWDTAEPYHYLRWQDTPEGRILLIGGADHHTGNAHEGGSYAALEQYARERFDISEIVYRWSAQFYDPTDGLPIIGKNPFGGAFYLATGYSGDGMTFGTLAGMIVADAILGKKNAYAKVFDPARLKLIGSKQFFTQAVDVAKHFIADRIQAEDLQRVRQLAPDQGCIARSGVQPIAAYREPSGVLRTFSAVCQHMKCVLHWNGAEKSFDCPCHGTRYNTNGEVIDGPATKNLPIVDIGEEEAREAA